MVSLKIGFGERLDRLRGLIVHPFASKLRVRVLHVPDKKP